MMNQAEVKKVMAITILRSRKQARREIAEIIENSCLITKLIKDELKKQIKNWRVK